jgi:hypothetical protein
LYQEDPAHLGYVKRIYNYNNTARYLEQVNPALQCPLPVSEALFGGAKAYTFAGNATYVYNGAASEVDFMSNGSGVSVLEVFSPLATVGTYTHYATTSGALARGLSQYQLGGTQRGSVEGTGVPVMPDSSLGVVAVGTPTFCEFSHGTARSPQYETRLKSAVVSSGAYLNPAQAGAPQHTLRWQSNSGNTLLGQSKSPFLWMSPGLNAGTRALLHAWIRSAYGIAP